VELAVKDWLHQFCDAKDERSDDSLVFCAMITKSLQRVFVTSEITIRSGVREHNVQQFP
jgi:hypothetical protein